MLAFQAAESGMTLEQGLRVYYDDRDDLVGGREPSQATKKVFRCHDVAHVVFGCSTRLDNEAMVELWSFFGTTAGLSLLSDYRSPESQEIYETIPWSAVPGTTIRTLVTAPRIAFRYMKMSKR